MKKKLRLALFLALLSAVYDSVGQCNYNAIMPSVAGSCNNVNEGTIELYGLENIQVGPGEMYSCDEGTLVSGTNITVNKGEVKRLTTAAWANITINGGTLIICGSVTTMNLTISNGGSLILNGGSFGSYGTLNIPAGCRFVNANGSVAFYGAVSVSGVLFNYYGSMAVYSTLTKNAGGHIMNNSTFNNVATGATIPDNYDENTVGTFSVSWTGTSQTGTSLKNLAVGNYTATISSGACSTTKTYNITSYAVPQVTVTKEDNTSSFCNGTLLASPVNENDYYNYLWEVNGQFRGVTRGISTLCGGTYNLTVTDLNGCTFKKPYLITDFIPHDSTLTGVDTTSHVDHPYIEPVDSTALLLTKSGNNISWNLTGIDFAKYAIADAYKEDTTFKPLINPSSFSIFLGDSISENIPLKNWEIEGIQVVREGIFKVTKDGKGNLELPTGSYENVNRVHVNEKYQFITNFGDTLEIDTMRYVLDNYYWYPANDSIHPILTYSTGRKYLDGFSEGYQQLVVTAPNTTNTNNDVEAFKRLINLRVSPNPAQSNISIKYYLPEVESVMISIDQSAGAQNVIYRGTLDAGEQTFNWNVSSYVPGTYTVHLVINNIVIAQTIVVNP